MHLLILGGSPKHLGGIEAFCERATRALDGTGKHRITRISTDTAYLTAARLPQLMKTLLKVARYRAQRPDCVWLQYGNLPDLVFLPFAKILGYRVMVTPHLGSNWRSQANPLLRWLSGTLLRMADRIAMISKTQALEIVLPPGVPRLLIRNFLPETIWDQPLSPTRDINSPELQLLHACRLSEGKGTFLVVEACRKLKDRGVAFKCRIAGGADAVTMTRLQDMIEQQSLQDDVLVLGRVPEAELWDRIRTSDVLVHPSIIDSYPLVILEALAYGVFPVCVDLAGASDMVETYTGHVVRQNNAVNEIVDFLAIQSRATLWPQSHAAAERLRLDYNWENCVRMLEAALTATATRPSN